MNEILRSYGWSQSFEKPLDALGDGGLEPGRVVAASRGTLRLVTAAGSRPAHVAGAIAAGRGDGHGGGDLPVVGDWVAYEAMDADGPARVREVLPRGSRLSRRAAGAATREQVVAANVDLIVVVMGLDGDYNPRRLERFLAMIAESGAAAAVVLNKADVCPDPAGPIAETRSLCGEAPVLVLSALHDPLDGLEMLPEPRRTATLVGSSGAGKTTLINRLLGEGDLPTGPVRKRDSRGRHTTTHRELFRLPGGALMIDNPGVREIQPWSAESSVPRVFADLEELAHACRFADCAHDREPGCAVRRAVADGELDAGRLEGWRRMAREAEAHERRKDERARRQHDKRLGKLYKSIVRQKRQTRG